MTAIRFGGRKEFIAAILLSAMGIIHVAMVVTLLSQLRRGYQDFTIFYTAGTMVRNGQTSSLYSLDAQYRAQKKFAPDVPIRQAALPFNHPPFEALLFVPFTVVGYFPAYGIWIVINLAMLAGSLALLRKYFKEIERIPPVLLGLAAAGYFPIAISLMQGQDSILLLFITALAMAAAAENRDTASGAVLALGLFKFHLLLPLALIMAMKRPRLLAGFLPVAVVLLVASVQMMGWRGAADYVQFVLHVESQWTSGGSSAFAMLSLHGLVSAVTGAYAESFWGGLFTATASVAVLVAAVLKVRKASTTLQHGFAVATVAAMLIGYHTMPHDLSLVFPAALFLFATPAQPGSSRTRTHMALLFLMFMTPAYVYLGLHSNRMGWFTLVLVCFFLCLLRDFRPAEQSDSSVPVGADYAAPVIR